MLYYVNWKLTNAQIDLIASDVSVVDYDYGNGKKKRKKSEFDDRGASQSAIQEANKKWLDEHKDDGGIVNIQDVLGGMKTNTGFILD